MPSNDLINIENLSIEFGRGSDRVTAVHDISLSVRAGKTLGLVGESGCGKSVTSLAIMGLLPKRNCTVTGSAWFKGDDLIRADEKKMEKIRGKNISMVFQEPMTSLNPVFTVGYQIGEVLRTHDGLTGIENRRRCLEILNGVSIPDAARIIDEYPHRLSGGMRQRVMIAMSVCCRPDLLIADEPTTALDVTIQSRILELFSRLQKELNTGMLFISHDLGVIAEVADDVAVLYAGRVVEQASAEALYDRPLHPYTFGLLNSRRVVEKNGKKRLYSIPGMVPGPHETQKGCSFAPRCARRTPRCENELPELVEKAPGHFVRCWEALA